MLNRLKQTLTLAAVLLIAGCASMKGLETQAKMDEPARLAAGKSLADAKLSPCGLAAGRLVEALWRPAARPADGRGADGQPHAAHRAGAGAQGARLRAGHRVLRSTRKSTPMGGSHAPALPPKTAWCRRLSPAPRETSGAAAGRRSIIRPRPTGALRTARPTPQRRGSASRRLAEVECLRRAARAVGRHLGAGHPPSCSGPTSPARCRGEVRWLEASSHRSSSFTSGALLDVGHLRFPPRGEAGRVGAPATREAHSAAQN